jgi:hypothetical protein
MNSFRNWSRIFGALSAVPIFWGLYSYWRFDTWATDRARHGEFICGTGIVAVVMLCATAGIALGLIAAVCSLCGYARSPKPRARKRLIEAFMVGGVPVLAAAVVMVAMVLHFFWPG